MQGSTPQLRVAGRYREDNGQHRPVSVRHSLNQNESKANWQSYIKSSCHGDWLLHLQSEYHVCVVHGYHISWKYTHREQRKPRTNKLREM